MAPRLNVPTPDQLAAMGAAVSSARQAAGMSQGALGATVGIGQGQVSAIENGAREMTLPQEVFAIETALGLPAGALSFHLGYMPVGATPPSVEAGIAADDTLDDAQKNLVAAYLAFIRS